MRNLSNSERKNKNLIKSHELWIKLSLSQSLKNLRQIALDFLKSELRISNAHFYYCKKPEEFIEFTQSEDHCDPNDSKFIYSSLELSQIQKPVFYLRSSVTIVGAIVTDDRLQWCENDKHLSHLAFNAIAVNIQRLIETETKVGLKIKESLKLETSELKRLNRELSEAVEIRSRFLSQMSHEIRTPLNSIIGISDLLMESELSKKYALEIGTIVRSGSNLLYLINDILDISKLHANEIKLDLHDFDLYDLIKEVIYLFKLKNLTQINLKYSIKPNVYRFRKGDSYRLKQVLMNIIGNAIKFTTAGKVTLTVEESEDRKILFKVTDTGIGIPKEKRKIIFNAFTQVDSSTTRKYGGTGLGLAICANIISLMKGNIWVEDNLIDRKGSIFYFDIDLPKAEKINIKSNQQDQDSTNNSYLGYNLSILVVDDSPENIILAKAIFKKTNFKIDYASNGRIAVEKFKKKTYDIIFMDLQMPELDGIQATQEIRKIEKTSQTLLRNKTTIIALTADAFNYDIDELSLYGFNRKITKPIKKNILLKEPIDYIKAHKLKQIPLRHSEVDGCTII